jgi:hypothetical protein
MCLFCEGCVARGRLGLLLADELLRVHFEVEGLLVRLRRQLLVRLVWRKVGRPSRERLRCLGRRLWVVRVGFVIVVVVATGSESVVVAARAAAVIVTLLATVAVSGLARQQEHLLAALVRAAVRVVLAVVVLALRPAMRRWWWAR